MKIPKILKSILISAILAMAFCTIAFAANGVDVIGKSTNGKGIPFATTEVTEYTRPSIKGLPGSRAGVYGVKVYPADSVQQVYYTDMYSTFQGNGEQWANGTLGAKTTALYKENNCDSFYVVATIYTDNSKNWAAYDNGILLGQGLCSSIPNSSSDFSLVIKCNSNPTAEDYGFWKVKLFDGNILNAWEVCGAIYLPN